MIPPAVDLTVKSRMYNYKRNKEIAGFESLLKMEEVIIMLTLKRQLGMSSTSCDPLLLSSDLDPKIKHHRQKPSRMLSDSVDC